MPGEFRKPAKDIEGLIDLCMKRGLEIQDQESAKSHLRHIGYFRLSGYMLPFKKSPGSTDNGFARGTDFSQIIKLYEFDRKLRSLTLMEIEKIEVLIRSAISDTMSLKVNPHWFMDQANFQRKFDYQ